MAIYLVWFRVYFDPIVWILSKQHKKLLSLIHYWMFFVCFFGHVIKLFIRVKVLILYEFF
jgi:hypothetical protein